MRVAIFTSGTTGDVRPFLALGRGLQAAGHDVVVGAPNIYGEWVSEVGLPFRQIGPQWQEEHIRQTMSVLARGSRRPAKQMQTLVEREILPCVDQCVADCIEIAGNALAAPADIIVSHSTLTAGRIATEKLDKPWVSVTLTPSAIPTSIRPPRGLPSLGRRGNRRLWKVTERLCRWRLDGLLNKARIDHGLAPLRNFVTEGMYSPTLNLVAASRYLPFGQEEWPDNHQITGYWFLDETEEWQPPKDLTDFLKAGPAPVYVGFGSMMVGGPERIGQSVIAALEKARVRGIVATGWGGLSDLNIPDTVFALKSAPHDWLFPQMSAVVHHGGAGTTAAGFRAGKPAVICPFLADQPYWARVARSQGASAKPLPLLKVSAKSLVDRIRIACSNAEMQRSAKEIGNKICTEDGVGNAVRLIEQMV